MSVLNPDHLLEQAELLLRTKNSLGQVRQVNRRRAISSAYYAVFHFTLTAVADEFIGASEREYERYALAYRSIDHRSLENLCRVVSKEQVAGKYVNYVPIGGFGPNIREFALLILDLKEKRNSADYDPSYRVLVTDARRAITTARSAIQRFKRASLVRRKAFLTLLAFPPR